MKYILLKKSQLTVSAVALFVAVTLAFTASSMISAATKRVLPIYSVDRDDKCISLTFDAAWSADDTDDIIRLLDK
ncbi:MAG: deacetylase, partial [Clostridia bacterium]|nr:deacetylase [Clostridia bacterium]